jgi:hypothetical protein
MKIIKNNNKPMLNNAENDFVNANKIERISFAALNNRSIRPNLANRITLNTVNDIEFDDKDLKKTSIINPAIDKRRIQKSNKFILDLK